MRLRLEHIPTGDNKIADLLSRGRVEEAKALVGERWGQIRDGAQARVRRASPTASKGEGG